MKFTKLFSNHGENFRCVWGHEKYKVNLICSDKIMQMVSDVLSISLAIWYSKKCYTIMMIRRPCWIIVFAKYDCRVC